MATFTQRGDKWRVQVRRDGYPPMSKTFMTKGMAEVWAKRVELDIERGVAGLGRKQPTVRVMLNRWLEEVAPTRRGERWDVIRVNRFLAGPPSLLDIDCNDNRVVQELRVWRDKRVTEVSGSTVARELAQLSGIFGHAIKEGWLEGMVTNPVGMLKRPAENAARTQRCTDAQLEAIVGPFNRAKPETIREYLNYMAWLAVETATRLGEICQLQWSDLNPAKRTLQVEHDLAKGKTTKTGVTRLIPLSKKAIDILQTLSDHYQEAEMADRIFPVQSESAGVEWRRMTKDAELSQIHFHDLRREATSRMAKKLQVEQLAKVTGHHDMGILLRVYYRPDISEMAALLD